MILISYDYSEFSEKLTCSRCLRKWLKIEDSSSFNRLKQKSELDKFRHFLQIENEMKTKANAKNHDE